jgi:hypothetical protein
MTFLKKYWHIIALILLVIGAFSFRVYSVMEMDNFSKDGYLHLDRIKSFRDGDISDLNKESKVVFFFSPLFYFLLGVFSKFFDIYLVAKIVPNLFLSLSIIWIFLISYESTKNKVASFICSLIFVFVPILYFDINSVSLEYFSFFMILLIYYEFLKLNKENMFYIFILLLTLLLSSSLSIFVALFFLFYVILSQLEKYKISGIENEFILFTIFSVIWANLLMYKNILLKHGFNLLWRNYPQLLLNNYFENISFMSSFYYIGIVPIILGLYGIYLGLSNKEFRKRSMFLAISFVFISFFLIWFKFVEFSVGLILLVIGLLFIASFVIDYFMVYFSQMKFKILRKVLFIAVILILVLTTIVPIFAILKNISMNSVSENEVNALVWISENLEDNSVVLWFYKYN